MRRDPLITRLSFALVAAVVGLAACSSDKASPSTTAAAATTVGETADTSTADPSSSDAASADTAGIPTEETATEETATGDTTSGDTSTDGTADGGAAPASLTGQQVCDAVTADTVATALGITIDHVVPSTGDTPQCAYVFLDSTGSNDNVTVAVERTDEDLDGRTGKEAFDYVADLNRSLAAGTDTKETKVDAGDEALVLAGTSISLGVIDVGGRIVAVIVPPSTGVTTTAKVAALITAVAAALS